MYEGYAYGWPELYIYTVLTVYLMISLPKISYLHRIFMVLGNPTYISCNYSAVRQQLWF